MLFRSVDVVEGRCRLPQALIKDKRFDGLFLLPAAQTRDKDAVRPEQMKKLCESLKEKFDYVIVDCPAGIEQGFKNAVAGADRAIVVTTPEVSAVRDADRIIGLLESNGVTNSQLVINRVRMNMVKRGDMMAMEDVVEILSIDLIGVVPDDENIVITTNKGEPAAADKGALAGKAFRNIAQRIEGQECPFLDLESGNGFFDKLKKVFGFTS